MKYEWQDLPRPLNCYTARNATMTNLNTGEIIRHYSTNTKIVVVQKCVTPGCTYYRTRLSEHHFLNYAFKASDLGLPNEVAPPAHTILNSQFFLSNNLDKSAHSLDAKQKSSQKATSSDGGEVKWLKVWLNKIFRRKNG